MPDPEWYRAWRHDELKRGFPQPQPRWKRALSAAMVVAALVFLSLNLRDAIGW